jgi:hypothetical protein
MRLVLLCLVAWLVLALAALASGGLGNGTGQRSPGAVVAN